MPNKKKSLSLLSTKLTNLFLAQTNTYTNTSPPQQQPPTSSCVSHHHTFVPSLLHPSASQRPTNRNYIPRSFTYITQTNHKCTSPSRQRETIPQNPTRRRYRSNGLCRTARQNAAGHATRQREAKKLLQNQRTVLTVRRRPLDAARRPGRPEPQGLRGHRHDAEGPLRFPQASLRGSHHYNARHGGHFAGEALESAQSCRPRSVQQSNAGHAGGSGECADKHLRILIAN